MFSKVVLTTHAYVPIIEVDIKDAVDTCSVMSRYNDLTIEMFDMTKRGWFGFPLYHYRDIKKQTSNLIDCRLSGLPIDMQFTSKFRAGQKEVLSRFESRVKQGATGFLFNARPAFGKTVCAIAMLAALGRTALIVVPRSNLVTQWKERLLEHSTLKASEIGIAISGKVSYKGKKVVVGLVHSLNLDRFGKDFRRYFGAIFFDEVDRSVPPTTFAPIISLFPAKYRVGISATMKRQDGLDKVFHEHMGGCVLLGTDVYRDKPKVLIHSFTALSGFLPPNVKTLNRRGMLLSMLAANPARNLVLCDYIHLIFKSDRRCAVLSDRIEQLHILRELLIGKFKVPRADIGFFTRRVVSGYTGKKKNIPLFKNLPQKERDRAAHVCKILLCTYGMFSVGSDVPDLAGLIFATPQSLVKQSKGRIERSFDGKKHPVLVDIVDTRHKDAVRWGAKRLEQYYKDNLLVKRV